MAAEDLCTLADVRAALELDTDNTDRDTVIGAFITPASVKVMDEVDREIAPADPGPTTRRFRVNTRRQVRGAVLVSLASPVSTAALHCDLRTVSTMTIHPESSAPVVLAEGVGGYTLDMQRWGVAPTLRLSRQIDFASDTLGDFGFCYLDIAGAWGFPSVPEIAKQAAIVTVMSWLSKPLTGMAEAPGDPGFVKPQVPPTYGLPPAAKALLAPLYRQRLF